MWRHSTGQSLLLLLLRLVLCNCLEECSKDAKVQCRELRELHGQILFLNEKLATEIGKRTELERSFKKMHQESIAIQKEVKSLKASLSRERRTGVTGSTGDGDAKADMKNDVEVTVGSVDREKVKVSNLSAEILDIRKSSVELKEELRNEMRIRRSLEYRVHSLENSNSSSLKEAVDNIQVTVLQLGNLIQKPKNAVVGNNTEKSVNQKNSSDLNITRDKPLAGWFNTTENTLKGLKIRLEKLAVFIGQDHPEEKNNGQFTKTDAVNGSASGQKNWVKSAEGFGVLNAVVTIVDLMENDFTLHHNKTDFKIQVLEDKLEETVEQLAKLSQGFHDILSVLKRKNESENESKTELSKTVNTLEEIVKELREKINKDEVIINGVREALRYIASKGIGENDAELATSIFPFEQKEWRPEDNDDIESGSGSDYYDKDTKLVMGNHAMENTARGPDSQWYVNPAFDRIRQLYDNITIQFKRGEFDDSKLVRGIRQNNITLSNLQRNFSFVERFSVELFSKIIRHEMILNSVNEAINLNVSSLRRDLGDEILRCGYKIDQLNVTILSERDRFALNGNVVETFTRNLTDIRRQWITHKGELDRNQMNLQENLERVNATLEVLSAVTDVRLGALKGHVSEIQQDVSSLTLSFSDIASRLTEVESFNTNTSIKFDIMKRKLQNITDTGAQQGRDLTPDEQASNCSVLFVDEPELFVTVGDESRFPPVNFLRNIRHDATVHFRCSDVGVYRLVGSNSSVCQDGAWTSSPPRCQKLATEEDIKANKTLEKLPSIRVKHVNQSITVDKSGTLVVRPGEDLIMACLYPRSRGQVSWLVNNKKVTEQEGYQMRWISDSKGGEFEYQITLTRLRNASSGVYSCVADNGDFHFIKVEVKDVTCPVLDIPAKSYIIAGKDKPTTMSSRITVQCHPGYQPEFRQTAVCLATGQWTTSGFSCSQIPDYQPPWSACRKSDLRLNPGVLIEPDQEIVLHSTPVHFSCASGSVPMGRPVTRCSNGKWASSSPHC